MTKKRLLHPLRMFGKDKQGLVKAQGRDVPDTARFHRLNQVGIDRSIADAVRENVNPVVDQPVRVVEVIDVCRSRSLHYGWASALFL